MRTSLVIVFVEMSVGGWLGILPTIASSRSRGREVDSRSSNCESEAASSCRIGDSMHREISDGKLKLLGLEAYWKVV